MAKHSSNLIAMALSRNALHLAELRGEGAAATVIKRSQLAWDAPGSAPGIAPESVTGQLPELPGAALGQALRAHLAEQGYAGRRVAVGLPGAWVLARRWDVPPVEDAALAGIVRLRVEKEFASGSARLAFDYTDTPPLGGQRGVLLVGVREDRLTAVREMLAAAGLQPVNIGVTALSVAAEDSGGDAGRCVVLEGSATTLVVQAAGRAVGLASTSTAADPARWTGDVSRLLATTPAPAEGGPLQFINLSADADQAALVAAGAMRWSEAVTRQADGAEAVGRAALSREAAAIDWLSDRMTPPKPRRVGRAMAWAIRVAAAVLLVGVVTGYFWIDATRQRDALRDEHIAIKADAQRLGEMHERTRAAAGWFDERPPVLDCLLELTRAFPKEGEVWVTQFSLDDDRRGVVRGKALDKETMLAYLQAMQRSAALQETQLRDWNESGREQRVVVFEITFRYDGAAAGAIDTAGSQIVDDAGRPETGVAG